MSLKKKTYTKPATKEEAEERMYTVAYYFLTNRENETPNLCRLSSLSTSQVKRALESYFDKREDLWMLANQSKNLKSFLRININK